MNIVTVLGVVFVIVIIVIVVVVVVGLRSPEASDPLHSRLVEYATREQPVSLQEIEMSQPFSERILLPAIRRLGTFATRFTPEATLENARTQLERAGNPGNLDPSTYLGVRIAAGVGLGLLAFFVLSSSDAFGLVKTIMYTLAGGGLGYFMPMLYMGSKASARQSETQKALPDALDLITICVEAGLGFDGAMAKVAEKWDNELAAGFSRVIREINLGKPRHEAMRRFSERMDVADLTSFIAAVIQADQLGVSMSKVLRIQSDQMRVRRRQHAEALAQKAPIKMLFPMAGCIFPALFIILLGPAVFILLNSGAMDVFGG